jgi:hypothetical protein
MAEYSASPGPLQGIEPLGLPPRAATENPRAVRPPRVELRIDQLVLEGVERADASAVAAAVQRELTRLASEAELPAVWQRGGSVQRLDAGGFQSSPGARPDSIGVEIARAVHRAVMGGQGK